LKSAQIIARIFTPIECPMGMPFWIHPVDFDLISDHFFLKISKYLKKEKGYGA